MLEPEIVMEQGPHTIPALGTKRELLVIEDNKTVREGLSRSLVPLGYKVTLARNVYNGGFLFYTRHYDLVIIDLQVPQLNVWKLASIFKEHSPSTPVIVNTGFNKGEPLTKADKDKVDAIIPKPFKLKEIDTTVQRLLNSRT